MNDSSQVGEARRFASVLCADLNFEETRRGRISIIINELGNNLVRYGREGRLILRPMASLGSPRGLEILSLDRGPGLDASVVMRDGFTTGITPGTGLGAVKRQSDVFDVYSQMEKGTVLLAQVYAEEPERQPHPAYEIGAISVPVDQEVLCGDAWAVRSDDGNLNILMADGLGHGSAANKAAREAVNVFETSAKPLPPDQMLQLVHGRLKSTRGGAVFLLNVVQKNLLEFTGAGNIRALAMSPGQNKTLISQNGTAGLQIRTKKALSQSWDGYGFLILHSDGINSRWDLNSYPGIYQAHPALLAGLLYRDFKRGNDDATVLVIRGIN